MPLRITSLARLIHSILVSSQPPTPSPNLTHSLLVDVAAVVVDRFSVHA